MITLAQLLARVDQQTLIQLTDPGAAEVDEAKVEARLADAWAEIEGYLYTLSEDARPPVATLDRHQIEIAMYLLAGNRPGEEFKSYAARYKASVEYLSSLKDGTGASNVDVYSEPFEPLMDPGSLASFGDPEVAP